MPLYAVEVRHAGLHKYRRITGNDQYVLEQKAQAQAAAWDEQWAKTQARVTAAQAKKNMKALAAEYTANARQLLKTIDETLLLTLSVDDRVDCDTLKDHSPFGTLAPTKPKPVHRPREPLESDAGFRPVFGILERLLRSRRDQATARAQERFRSAHATWRAAVNTAEQQERLRQQQFEEALVKWRAESEAFAKAQSERNGQIDERRRMYESKDSGAIADYCDLVLSRSKYPDFFPQDYQLDYIPDTAILLVDYALPAPDAIPKVKEVRYVQSRDAVVDVTASEAEANRRYDSLLYQICLRTLHELFEADEADAVRAVVFNGWVQSIDRATGKEANACVMSVQVEKNAFMSIDVARVDPKECFRSLKGVGSSKLHGLAPVAPILTIDRNDRRFVQGRDVVERLDEGVNLAAMDWQDFEHLIRQVFEAKFASGGGEVKVTQASRDGGVDAVAFDPDPIRGGKIVIQAKRYTNVVGVSAVRDLYGTVINEGATKGILVTTSEYGPDAYDFANGKPLTLLNGSNLLSLLAEHGHKARIDLKEARELLAEQEATDKRPT